VLRNSQGRRFMFDDIPELYKGQTSTDEEEGWRYTQGDKNAKRPPELLTRDHVARCIRREIKEGRGSPHGGVFLDIAWIKEKLPNAPDHIKKKLPSMYHQFKELAGVDITKEPMEVGPTTHYIMGGVRVDPDTQMTSTSGLFAAGECAAGLHGANRLGGNSLSDLLVFGKRAGEFAARYAKEAGEGKINSSEVEEVAAGALAPFEREMNKGGENPFQIQSDLQEMMQDLVGIVRTERELGEAIGKINELKERASQAACGGNRGYNPGWHTAIELKHMLTVAEAIAIAARERKESRGGHFREDFPDKSEEFSKLNIGLKKATDGSMQVEHREKAKMREDLAQIISEMK
jgi:succinate dehydrogenase / fumarate reductase flavoprotein subunit